MYLVFGYSWLENYAKWNHYERRMHKKVTFCAENRTIKALLWMEILQDPLSINDPTELHQRMAIYSNLISCTAPQLFNTFNSRRGHSYCLKGDPSCDPKYRGLPNLVLPSNWPVLLSLLRDQFMKEIPKYVNAFTTIDKTLFRVNVGLWVRVFFWGTSWRGGFSPSIFQLYSRSQLFPSRGNHGFNNRGNYGFNNRSSWYRQRSRGFKNQFQRGHSRDSSNSKCTKTSFIINRSHGTFYRKLLSSLLKPLGPSSYKRLPSRTSFHRSHTDQSLVQQEFQGLLPKGAIEFTSFHLKGFLSYFLLVKKENQKLCPVINLPKFNRFCSLFFG